MWNEKKKHFSIASTRQQAIDGVYFNAASRDGYQLVVENAHRPHGVVNGFMCIWVDDIRQFQVCYSQRTFCLISFFLVHLTTFMTAECVLYSIKLEDDVE
jgi:hypothetical protein